MTVDGTEITSISEQKQPIPKKRPTAKNLKSLLTNYTKETHAPDVASRDESSNSKIETHKFQIKEKNNSRGRNSHSTRARENQHSQVIDYPGERDRDRAYPSERITYHQYGNT